MVSVLPPPPTVSSSRTRLEREPPITLVKPTTPVADQDSTSSSSDESDSDGDFNSDTLGSIEPPVRIGPPKSKTQQHGKFIDVSGKGLVPDGAHGVAMVDISASGKGLVPDGARGVAMVDISASGKGLVPDGARGVDMVDISASGKGLVPDGTHGVAMVDVSEEVVVPDGPHGVISIHSPTVLHSQRGRARNVKSIGSFNHSQPVKSSGASRTYGGVIGNRALGNAPNIGDFDSMNVNSQFVDVEGTVNLFPSNMHPTTMDIDETAVIAVIIPFEEALAPLLQQVVKYYSPLRDNNARVYILDSKKHKWIVKGRYRDAIEFEDSVFQYWDQTDFGPTLTIFLENDPEIASAIPPSFQPNRSISLVKSRSTSRSSPAPRMHSGSTQHSGSVARPSPGTAAFKGPSTLTDLHKDALLTFLCISTELPKLSDSLRNTYKKYQACIAASEVVKGLRSSNTWANHLEEFGLDHWVPHYIDLLNIFISKTQFYSTWQPPFKRVQKFPKMIEWLENKEDCPSDSEIWVEEKHPDEYSLADLTSWINRKEVVKGKKPVVASSSGKKLEKRKKERKVSSSEESSPEERKKSKSKSKKKLSE